MFPLPYKLYFQVTTILVMTDYCMHKGSFGSSNITLWDVLWGEFNIYSIHLYLCPPEKQFS
jgi:hypothetical protein